MVAEGVEDVSVLPLLSAAGCATYQGFLYSQPVSAASMATLLAEPHPAPKAKPADPTLPEAFGKPISYQETAKHA